MKELHITEPGKWAEKLLKDVVTYTNIHHKLFGKYTTTVSTYNET